jgi:hypothetical protein
MLFLLLALQVLDQGLTSFDVLHYLLGLLLKPLILVFNDLGITTHLLFPIDMIQSSLLDGIGLVRVMTLWLLRLFFPFEVFFEVLFHILLSSVDLKKLLKVKLDLL